MHPITYAQAIVLGLLHGATELFPVSSLGRRQSAAGELARRQRAAPVRGERVLRSLPLRHGAMPQDAKLSPDGRTFYVADMASNGVWLIDARSWRKLRFQPTGRGAHGLYPSRDSRRLFVSNRGEGSISVLSFRTRRPVAKWRIPGGGSPDMGGVSADGRYSLGHTGILR